jgi:2-polyprenyl-6-hydroxyphenyl methylase/3-demethylubiquinone-9 3-methyltransferase
METTFGNVSQEEIDKFGDLAARWWDTKGEFSVLHKINPVRLAYIEERVGGLSGKTILDVGCGGGILSESMAAQGAIVTGIDMSEPPLQVAQLHLQESQVHVEYHCKTVEQVADEQPEYFDVVTCMEMLEHVPSPESVIEACCRVLKPEGHLFFSTLNRTRKAYIFAIIGAEYVFRLLPRGTHDYAKFIQPMELARWARKSGLEIKALTGMHYNPVTGNCHLKSDVSINYIAYAQRI